jgi:hypothetical protein
MASEKFANLAETTLASGYTSGTTTLAVTSAAGFPTTGVFRVRLGNAGKTIWRVDSVSGTTFTGGAEEFDANANSGDTVTLVATKAVAERFIQSPEPLEILAPSGAAGAIYYGPIRKLMRPNLAGGTWENQGGSSIVTANGVEIFKPAITGTRMLLNSAPSTPYKIEFVLLPGKHISGSGTSVGVCLRESSSGNIVALFWRGDGVIQINTYTATNTFGSNQLTTGAFGWTPWPLFFRLQDNGTNVLFEYSPDGAEWTVGLSETRGTHFTTAPNQYGYFSDSSTAGQQSVLSILIA